MLRDTLRGHADRHGVDATIDLMIAETDALNAEIDSLKAEVAKRDRALAAGPAALRSDWIGRMLPDDAAEIVEAAQEAAMEEKP